MTLSADRPLQLDVRREKRGVVISAHGNVDALDAPQLLEELQSLVPETRQVVVLDLSDLDFIGPDGLDALLTVRKALQAHHGQIHLVHPHPEIRRMLQVTRLTEILPIFDTVAEALG